MMESSIISVTTLCKWIMRILVTGSRVCTARNEIIDKSNC